MQSIRTTRPPQTRAANPAARTEKQALGIKAERAAQDYLLAHGYNVLESNYRCSRGEIDIIAEDEEGVLCFVEVRSRTRTPADFGRPIETISEVKRRKIIRTAEHFICTRQIDGERSMRFDVVGIVCDGQFVTLELVKDAFQVN